jgi:beta-glucosidase/6-phospho-beta-glucosidase/beta-galactosidase
VTGCETDEVSERPRILATLEGYAVEGGLDVAGGPATCFSPSIALGRVAGPGDAEALWHDYEAVIDAASTLGVDGVRLGVEWARVEPRRGEVDDAALERYRAVAAHARSRGLRVSVALVDGAWPAWLGLEAWLLPWVEPRCVEHARRVVSALGDQVDGLVVFADPAGIVERGYLWGTAPPWRRGARADAASAAAQVARIAATLRDDPLVGPLVVDSARTVSLDAPASTLASLGADPSWDEVHLRALVAGVGPRAAPAGLLVRADAAWVARVPRPLGGLLA